jgi:hypothetical protein
MKLVFPLQSFIKNSYNNVAIIVKPFTATENKVLYQISCKSDSLIVNTVTNVHSLRRRLSFELHKEDLINHSTVHFLTAVMEKRVSNW